jgi:SAM-dependent methyltransferase
MSCLKKIRIKAKLLLIFLLSNKAILKFILELHSISYSFISLISTRLNNGIHPKHQIIKYKEWFAENIKANTTILDIGCSTGLMCRLISKKAKKVYGIDINNSAIDCAKKNNQVNNVEYIHADATVFNYQSIELIDCVLLSNVLEHIDDRVLFIKNIIKKVKWRKKVKFLIRVPMIDRDWLVLYKKQMGVSWKLDKTHFTEYTLEEFSKEIEQCNLKILKYSIRWGEIYAEIIGKK